MDTELFMECEEEELEPWQQVDDSVEEDDDIMDTYGEPIEDSPSPQPASETPPPRTPPPSRTPPPVTPAPAASCPVRLVSSSLMPPRPPTVSCTSSGPPVVAQAPPLILTQTAGGAFLLPAAPGTGSRQPILLTTQGFPMQTMMSSGGSLLLNLQPGQTVQPLTLIQSSSALGQLVRPNVGVSPVLPQGQTIQARPTGGSTFSTVQLPTTLTIHTSTSGAVNLHMTQVGGANSLKLAGSPALPSGSANGVATFSSATTSVVSGNLTSDCSRVVMSVEEFYYGTFEGDLSLRRPPPLGLKTSTFTCLSCSHLAENNLRLMQHMLQHSDLVGTGGFDERKCCRFCYRQFSSFTQVHTHQDQVHSSSCSSCICRICEWAFENEPSFLNHMKTNHKPGEMPYVCQVCSYRSSFYSNVLQHFASFHRDSRFLLCVFCLKVTRNPVSFQQHVLRHQRSQAFHCNRCRLQFVLLKDKLQHKLENHRTFRRPDKLQGLPPGSKVTIRTYGKIRPPIQSTANRLLQSPASLIQPINIKTEVPRSPLNKNVPISRSARSPTKRPIARRLNVNRSWTGEDHLLCLECGTNASDLSAHYPTHVHCLLCPYSSCCSRAYAAHMIHHHVRHKKDTTLHKLPPPCVFLLRCSSCDFQPQTADQMADHLLFNPLHHSATCLRKNFGERDIEFSHIHEQQISQEQIQDSLAASWRCADSWKEPVENAEAAIPFKQPSGPLHSLSKNSDAVDFFNLMFPSALVELITNETNAHAKISHFLDPSSSTWTPVTTHEIKGFIGLVILMGIQNLPNPAHYWSWSHYDNSYTFYRTMSLKRFNQIAANICMGSFTTDEHRGTENPSDSLHIFRPMLNILGGAMWKAYRPNCCLTIDRALLPSLEENSAVKAGPKTQPQVWLLCDSKSGYCHRFFIQAEQRVNQELGFTVVPELVKDLEDKHHQLYLASSLTSVPLMQKLLDQGIYASSSFPPPNSILPQQLWEEGWLEKPGDFLQRQFGPLLATRWRDTKEMGCLSTNAAPGEADTVWRRSLSKVGELDPIDRPMAFRLLQDNMRGVDICKQLLACNPLGGIPQDRYWRSLFWFLINVSIVNAFIMLRESRKESPPAWVQDGLFTQVTFRKRLGNQLAKCAQKYFETMEMANSRRMKMEEELPKQRHHIGKVTSLPRRCKVCNLKNVRRETVYGCTVCKANLCKDPSCFWEYHGMSPRSKGSTKVGFLKDQTSGAIEVDEVQDDVDQTMAPVEELDFSDDDRVEDLDDAEDTEAFQQELPDDMKHQASNVVSAVTGNARPSAPSKEREDSMSARQLRITLFALCDGLLPASRFFSTDTRLIRSWLKDAKRHLAQSEHEQTVEGIARMVSWVLSMREQQLPITESNLFHKASMLKKKGSFSDSFRISYDWAVNFLLQNRLGPWSVGREATLSRILPQSLEAKVRSFREFTQKVVHVHQLPEGTVAAMDELCLFVDFRLVKDKSRQSEALELTGSLPLVTVYLTALADGTVLPALIMTSQSPGEKALPESVLLEVSMEGLQVEEMLDIWTNKVWLQFMNGPTRPCKSMLVLDRHREHLGDQFLTSISTVGTLPAVIPGGCTFSLQPLEVCVKPVLQRLLLSRWSKFTAGNPKELEEVQPQQLQTNVTQLLVDWVAEVLTYLHTVPHLLKKSFELTALLPRPQQKEAQEKTVSEKPEEVQLELLRTLTEKLLGTDASGSPDFLGLRNEDDFEEEQQGGATVEVPEEKQDGVKEVQGDSQDNNSQKEAQESWTENMKKLEEANVKDEKEDRKQDAMNAEDSEEDENKPEEKEAEEEHREANKERRETRIVIGEEVGDEWKLTVKNRTEAAEDDES